MYLYRRRLHISWVDRITNEEVLRRIGKDKELLTTVRFSTWKCHFLPIRNVDDRILRSRSSGDGGISKWKRRFLKIYGELSCAVHFQEAERVKT